MLSLEVVGAAAAAPEPAGVEAPAAFVWVFVFLYWIFAMKAEDLFFGVCSVCAMVLAPSWETDYCYYM